MNAPFWPLLVAAIAAQTAVLPPSDNLVLQDVPRPPMSLVYEAERYTEFRSATMADWHPDRKEMLIETRFGDTTQVHRVKMPGGARTQLTFYRDNARRATYQPTEAGFMLFDKDRGGDEFFQKYSYAFDNKQTTMLTDGKSRNTGGVWSNKGDRYAYGSTQRNGEDVDIHVVRPPHPESDKQLLQTKGGGWEALDWSPDDQALLVNEIISANESHLWLVDSTTGAKTALTPPESKEKVAYAGGAFSRDGHSVYATTDKDSEFRRLAKIDLDTKRYTYLSSAIPWDIDSFALSWDGTKIAALVNENGLSVLHLFDTTSGKELPKPLLPQGQVSGLCWHKNNRDLAFNIESAHHPNDVYSLDVATGVVERWTESEVGGITTNDLPEPQLVAWKSFDGKEISAFVYRPPAKFTGRRPVVINIHGGPEGQWRPHYLGRTNYMLEEQGVTLIFPNVRGSTGYGKSFLLADNGLKREDSYKDIGSLLDWIKQQPDLDSDRIMVTGGSYGGFMTLAVATWYSDRIRCALDVVGPSNLVTFLESTQAYRRDLRRAEYGDERDPKTREFLNRIAPANNADRIKKPLFVVQGKNDPRVPYTESQQMVEAIRKSGTPVWYLMANDEGHGFSKKHNNDYLFYTTLEFMQKYLLN